jgi:prepilin-type N-terminal cleavage/methylation domain-containing protein
MAASSLCRPSDSRGFSLVELLVVIVIIGILAGLLVPAIAGVIHEGKSVACRSNLQQLHKLGTMWSASHKGHWPQGQGGELWVSFTKTRPPLLAQGQCEILRCAHNDAPASPDETDFLGPVQSYGRIPDTGVLAADKDGNHGEGRALNVLRKDGSAQSFDLDDPIWETVRAQLKP